MRINNVEPNKIDNEPIVSIEILIFFFYHDLLI